MSFTKLFIIFNQNPTTLLVLILLLIYFTRASASGIKARSDYNETCSKTSRCKTLSWLSCNYETSLCQCAKPDEMVYSPSQGKCLVLLGEKCKFGFESGETDPTTGWYEKADCGLGAECGQIGVCICPEGFYEDLDKNECLPVKSYGKPCEDNECDADKLLTCNRTEGFCRCHSQSDMTFDSDQEVCLSLLGKGCGPITNGTTTYGRDVTCLPELECSAEGICICPKGRFVDITTQNCIPIKTWGEKCTLDTECNHDLDLSCVRGLCHCNPTTVYNYDTFEVNNDIFTYRQQPGSCLKKAGQSCNVDFSHLYNLLHEEGYYEVDEELRRPLLASEDFRFCMKGTNCRSSICECESWNEATTSQGLCGYKWGATCYTAEPCSDSFACVKEARTYSKQRVSKCQCHSPDYQEYDPVREQCIDLVGSPCSTTHSCLSNAECVKEDGTSDKVCKCQKGFVENLSRHCDVGYGYGCVSTDQETEFQCDSVAELECKTYPEAGHAEFTCLCRNLIDIYEPEERRCASPVGTRCHKREDCVQNSECGKGQFVWNICLCSEGFQKSYNKTCIPKHSFNEFNL